MGLVAAKCTQCGANIEVDDTNDAGICKYCGTAFVTEKVINNYNITNNNIFLVQMSQSITQIMLMAYYVLLKMNCNQNIMVQKIYLSI